MPVFAMIEIVLVKELNFSPGIALRLVARTLFIGNVLFPLPCSNFCLVTCNESTGSKIIIKKICNGSC